MTFDEKLRQLRRAARPHSRDEALERTLEYLRSLEQRRSAKKLPGQRAPKSIEQYVEGQVLSNAWGDFFLARQWLPFGRPYGKIRVGDISGADLESLSLFLEGAALPPPSRLVYLDTETTGLAGGTGTCAFLIGLGAIEGSQFVVRQFFLRDYPEEKAILEALGQTLEEYDALVTFNGKTFDLPLLDTRYTLARLRSPFGRLIHLDMLYPARRLWKLRLENCQLTHLEREVLGIRREGDVEGAEIPEIYFDYLRTGDARGLQPVFYHNALDIVTLAALTVELARTVAARGVEGETPSLDLFSLSRILDRAGATDQSLATCRRALEAGLPQSVESRALWHLASQYKRQRKHEEAVAVWLELTRRKEDFVIEALEELAIYHEHRQHDVRAALQCVEEALEWFRDAAGTDSKPGPAPESDPFRRFTHRLARLRRKGARAASSSSRLIGSSG